MQGRHKNPGIVSCIQSKEPYDERSYIQAQTLYST